MSSAPAGARLCAFDELAGTYDVAFTDTSVGRALRNFVWERLEHTFRASSSVLELGCGTGEDAIRLAGMGARVVAIDSSAAMLRLAAEKARRAGYAGRIEFHCLPMEDLASVLAGRRFDGVLSNFGAVNCVRDLPALAAEVATRLTPGAPLLWVVMGKHVPWEWAWFLAQGDWRKASRRFQAAGVEWRGLTISYPTPSQITRILERSFSLRRLSPLGLVLPPSYAAGWLDRFPRVLSGLTRLESLARRSSRLAALADHYIVEATRSAA